MTNDEKWMKIALKEATRAAEKNEVPVGAILIKENIILAKAHNQPVLSHDVTAHAEIQLLRIAGKKQKNYRLPDTTLYVTLEPCMMCLSAIFQARIYRVVFGAFNLKLDAFSSSYDLASKNHFNHKIMLTGGILEHQCSKLLQDFFKIRR